MKSITSTNFQSIIILFLLIVCLACTPLAAECADGSRKALIIANWKYADAPLVNPENDAVAMEDALRDATFDIQTHRNINLWETRKIAESFAATLSPDDTVLFYYAGHAVQSSGQNYLVPIGTRIEHEADISRDCFPINTVLRFLKSASPKRTLVILDACRNNPFGTKQQNTASRNVIPFGSQEKRNIFNRGLAAIQASPGLLIAYATAPGMTALDGHGTPNSPFTGALTHHIRNSGWTIEDVLRAVRRDVVLETDGYQVPWDENRLLDTFYFHPDMSSQQEIQLRTRPMNAREVSARGHFETRITPGKWVRTPSGATVWQHEQREQVWIEEN